MEEKSLAGKGFAIASLVTGILSIMFLAFIIISIILAICSIVFGILAKKKNNTTIMAKAGFALGIISLSITSLLFLFLNVLDVSLFIIPSWYR